MAVQLSPSLARLSMPPSGHPSSTNYASARTGAPGAALETRNTRMNTDQHPFIYVHTHYINKSTGLPINPLTAEFW